MNEPLKAPSEEKTAPLSVRANEPANAIAGLRKKLLETTSPELASVREKFERIYERLAEAAAIIVQRYKKLCTQYRLAPGIVRLYMVGGRVKGKPLKADSDIDLMFCVEHPTKSLEGLQTDTYSNPLDAAAMRTNLMKQMRAEAAQVCETMNIPNEFHILSYGSPMPETAPADSLLLAEA